MGGPIEEGWSLGLVNRLRVYPFSVSYFRKIFPQDMEGKKFGIRLNSLYFLWLLRETNHGMFFAPLELRRRWGTWIKDNLWVLTIKNGQKKSLLKE